MADCGKNRKRSIFKARNLFSGLKGRDAVDSQVRKTLVDSLYSNPLSLLIGAVAGSGICIAAALTTDSSALQMAAWSVGVVAVLRVALLVAVKRTGRDNTRAIEILFELGAFAYAGALSLVAAMAIYFNIALEAKMLLVVVAVSYATAIAARNAGRPTIALGQLLLVLLPLSVTMLMSDAVLIKILGVATLLHIPSTISITRNVYTSLRDSIASANTNAKLAQDMETLAHTDVVTGLTNRAGLNHLMVETMTELAAEQMLTMFWLDLDRFKEVNDLLGHQVGDRVLQETAARLSDVMPEDAIVARFGGDEFTVVCKVADRRQAEMLASEVHAELMRPIRINGDRLEVGASIGVSLLPDDGTDADTLMQNADLALYHAKVNGRKQTHFYDSSMSRELARKREIEAELRAAIMKDELSIFFQPIVDLETGRIKTFEALVRWFHPTKGELRPDEFISIAEDSGLIVTLGNWITVQAAKAAAQWPEDVTLAVNLSPLQIKAPGASLGIFNALREAGLAPERLELEVTESLFVDDSEATEVFISELAAKGVRFALDDFGTGYSSLGYIQKYPFSKVKIDRSFVSGPDVGRKTEAIIRAVAEMGAQLDMSIVAEGLEEIEQVKAVREAGCTLGQGYYFSRAVPDYLAAMLLAQERESDQALRKVG